MRARNIKPGFFKNDTLAELDFAGRLLFIGLWGIADREGRLGDRPKKIKAEIFPYDDVDVDSFLGELARLGFILRYAASEAHYIQIVNFDKHQNPHPREAASLIPEPTGACPGSAQDMPSRAESPSLTTDSPSQGLLTTTTIAEPAGEFAAVVDLISKNICLVSSPVESDLIRAWLETMPPGWVSEAIHQAALGKARSLRYVDTILRAWAAKYRPDELPWLIERRERQQRPVRDRPQTFMERAEAMLCQH
jgi:DnaD/phage-associated family protein